MASISKRILESGKPQWRVSYVDAQGRRKRPGFSTWREADSFRQDIEEKLRKGTYRANADSLTINEVCDAYLGYCLGRMERNERMTQKMYVVYRGHVNNHILGSGAGLAGRKLSQVTPAVVVEFRDALRTNGVSISTTRKIIATLHSALEFAISRDWIAMNAAHGVRVIGSRGEGPKQITPPDKEDLKKILERADFSLRLKIMFAALTGLRASEQWGLKWKDVDLGDGTIHVRRRIDSYGNEGSTKSKAGVRDIPISRALISLLKEHILSSPYKGEEDFVFANSKGRQVSHDNLIKRHFKPLLAEIDVEELVWHSLRHFAVSTWIEQGLSAKSVQTYAGHSSLSVTMDRYGHMFPNEEHKARMDAIAGEILGLPQKRT